MDKSPPLIEGSEHAVAYPFILESVDIFEDDGEGGARPVKSFSWRPGTNMEPNGSGEEYYQTAHGMGSQILTVVSTHKPGKYPERVFFTRQWRDPTGKIFGKAKLRVTTSAAFRALLRGFRYPFEVVKCPTT